MPRRRSDRREQRSLPTGTEPDGARRTGILRRPRTPPAAHHTPEEGPARAAPHHIPGLGPSHSLSSVQATVKPSIARPNPALVMQFRPASVPAPAPLPVQPSPVTSSTQPRHQFNPAPSSVQPSPNPAQLRPSPAPARQFHGLSAALLQIPAQPQPQPCQAEHIPT